LGVIFCMSWKKLTTNVVNQKWFNNYGNWCITTDYDVQASSMIILLC
jgi:hypothetical protein